MDRPHRSIRDITVTDVRRTKKHTETESETPSTPNVEEVPQHTRLIQLPRRRKRGGRNKAFIAGSVVLLALLIYTPISLVFGGAEINVLPRQEAVKLDGTFVAARDAAAGELQYEVITIKRDVEREVDAIGEEEVDRKASGVITISNNFSDVSQRLITNTRFETPEGLIYRIREPVVVPGKDGGAPGTLDVTVYADTSGEEYNIGSTDFTIPGFKDDPGRFAGFSARSKTLIEGGFSGIMHTVSEEGRTRAEAELHEELREVLMKAFEEVEHDDLVVFPESIDISFMSLPQGETGKDNTVFLREQGVLTSTVFTKEDFAQYLAENTIADYDGGQVTLQDISSMTLSSMTEEADDTGRFSFSLVGDVTIIWTFDSERLALDLAGKLKTDATRVLSGYPGIDHADITIRPFWKQSFPEKAERIMITEHLEA